MNYPVAELSVEQKQRIKQLEDELGVILIAYQDQDKIEEDVGTAYVDDSNVNLI